MGACLYHCFDLIPPDVVLELAWRFDLMNLAMPFMVQTVRTLSTKVSQLEEGKKELEEKVEAPQAGAAAAARTAGLMDSEMNDGSAYYDSSMADQYATMIQSTPQSMQQNYYYGM